MAENGHGRIKSGVFIFPSSKGGKTIKNKEFVKILGGKHQKNKQQEKENEI